MIVSDGGPTFESQAFNEFLQGFHVMCHLTSIHHPFLNGLFEGGVISIKNVLEKTKENITKPLLGSLSFKLNNQVMPGPRDPSLGAPGLCFLMTKRIEKQQKLAEKAGCQSRDKFRQGEVVKLKNPTNGRWDRTANIRDEKLSNNGITIFFIVYNQGGQHMQGIKSI